MASSSSITRIRTAAHGTDAPSGAGGAAGVHVQSVFSVVGGSVQSPLPHGAVSARTVAPNGRRSHANTTEGDRGRRGRAGQRGDRRRALFTSTPWLPARRHPRRARSSSSRGRRVRPGHQVHLPRCRPARPEAWHRPRRPRRGRSSGGRLDQGHRRTGTGGRGARHCGRGGRPHPGRTRDRRRRRHGVVQRRRPAARRRRQGPIVLDDQNARQGTDAECAALRPDVDAQP
jgi:hypothetical protein